MSAYNEVHGFVGLDEEKTRTDGKLFFHTSPEHSILVVVKARRVMLNDKIMQTASTTMCIPDTVGTLSNCRLPKLTWVNGEPGCVRAAE